MEETARELSTALDSKVLIDATNNFGSPVINSLAHLRAAAPSASLFRAFNSLGWELFADPQLDGQQVDLFYCGPDGDARRQVEGLIAEIGLRPLWVGDNDRVHLVDNIGALWVQMVRQRGWPAAQPSRRWRRSGLNCHSEERSTDTQILSARTARVVERSQTICCSLR
jgi:predicted dinucleotide-binding enzyme